MPVLFLVRHASAGQRGSGPDDLQRPLDARGLVQAAALPALLRPYLKSAGPLVDVRASPARRCIETLKPLAVTLSTEVVADIGLIEGCDVAQLFERLASLIGSTVWSSHGDVIPTLLAMLARRGLDLGAAPSCRKGSTWVIDVENGAAQTARFIPPSV